MVKFVIACIQQLSLGDSKLLMNVTFLALSLEMDVVEGQAIIAKAIKQVFMSVSGLLVTEKLGRKYRRQARYLDQIEVHTVDQISST